MSSKTIHVLATGDYWHEDFADEFSRIESPVTMVPVERLDSIPPADYDVIVLAQSRRDQFSQTLVDSLRAKMPHVPVVALLGSWCEGQNRSGEPLLGVNDVHWHQWRNRFELFSKQLQSGDTPDWQQPLTATVADRVRDLSIDSASLNSIKGTRILISSLQRTSFESLRDALSLYHCDCAWNESSTIAKDAEFDLVCVDGNTATDDFRSRVEAIRNRMGEVPVIAILNAPRQQDFTGLASIGVFELIAKPFLQQDLVLVAIRALQQHQASSDVVPKPRMLKRESFSDRERL